MKKVNLKYINNNETGFALIACLSILSLLVMLSKAMVSLASVSQRTAIGSEALEEAEANARLALSEAIANLQRKAGLDTRITASARSVSVNSQSSSFVTGVWRSWEGTNHSVEALPHMPGLESDTPGYDDKLVYNNLFNTMGTTEGRFLGWLVSGSQAENTADDPPDLSIGSVSLLGSGSLGSSNNSEIVRVDPTLILDGNGNVTGGQAYWVQGLNSKALMKKPAAAPATGLERASNMSSNASPNVENFDIDPSEALENFVSLATLDFVKEDLRKNNFHDITHYSRGLLTNSATGGWRRDLSLLMEGWWDANASDRKFDETRNFFTLEPGVEFSYTASESVNTPYFIYPFSSKFDHVNEQNGSNIGSSSSSWNAVGDFMMQYKQVDSLSDDGYARFSPRSSELDRSGRGRNRDIRLRWRRDLNFRQPNLARFHYIYYLGAEKDESTDTYSAKVLIEPYITYWNPYNVEVDAVHSGTEVTLISALPFNIKLEVGSGAVIELDQLASNNDFTVDFNDATAGVMQPGETRIFSGSPNESLNNTLNMVNGVSTEEAQIVKDLGADFSNLDAEDIFTVELVPSTNADLRSIRFVQQTAGGTAPMNIRFNISEAKADALWSNVMNKVNEIMQTKNLSLKDLADNPQPFLAGVFQLKTVPTEEMIEFDSSNVLNAVVGRGYSQNKITCPVMSEQIVGQNASDDFEAAAYEWVFQPIDDINNNIPEGGAAEDPYGFVGTGFQSSTGLKRMVVTEIPSIPIQSLGQLQHLDIAMDCPYPPMTIEQIGNSNASYLIAPNSVKRDNGIPDESNGSLDHSYIGNHLLFDDWFVSSIHSKIDTLEDTFDEFLKGEKLLENELYKPAKILTGKDVDPDETWRFFASHIEVEGMFNVNSTSVEAWKAILKHLRNAEVPQFNLDSVGIAPALSDETPFTRTSIVGGGTQAQAQQDLAALGGPARLSDEQIDALAKEIVEQIRKRGPFLSIAEFVNRKLTNDPTQEELALSGAIESALTSLSKMTSSALNPYSDFQNIFTGVNGVAQLPNLSAGSSYAFQRAGEGSSVYGYPGWVRQADIIENLAPIMSVRDDSFIIRAYGSSIDSSGNIAAEAWCEAVVQRRADYIDSQADDAKTLPGSSHLAAINPLTSTVNKVLGRKFDMISFKWLTREEI